MSDAAGAPEEALTPLSGKQKRFLRALAQSLDPVLIVGKQGVTEETISALRDSFNRRELIKIRVQHDDPRVRKTLGHSLAERVGAHVVQVIGRVVILYRPAPEDAGLRERIQLPDVSCS